MVLIPRIHLAQDTPINDHETREQMRILAGREIAGVSKSNVGKGLSYRNFVGNVQIHTCWVVFRMLGEGVDGQFSTLFVVGYCRKTLLQV